jgi:ribosomal protein S12 methylthiotransferase
VLVAGTSIPWFRMLYLYSTGITPKLLDLLAREPRVLPYIDMPIQHAADAVLARMRRPERQRTIRERVRRFRDAVPDATIRTTCIVGFPGETEADFDELLAFLEEIAFDRVGAFTYSPQEGTRAHALPDDVPDDVKRDRLERLSELQRAVTAERYERHLGRVAPVLIDRPAGAGTPAEGRAPWQADDVDGVTRLHTDAPAGALVTARFDDVVDDYDFTATAAGVVLLPAARAVGAPRRALPTLGGTMTIGSYGR